MGPYNLHKHIPSHFVQFCEDINHPWVFNIDWLRMAGWEYIGSVSYLTNLLGLLYAPGAYVRAGCVGPGYPLLHRLVWCG